MREKDTLLRGIGVNYLYLFVNFIYVLVLTPIIIRYLGQSTYGLWVVFSSISGYFILLDFGMNTAVAKYTAEFRAINKEDDLNRIISTTFVLVFFMGILILVICIFLLPFIPEILNIKENLVSVARISFLIMALNVVIWLIGGVFGNIIYGFQRIDIWKMAGIIQLIINALFVVTYLRLGFGLIGLAVAFTCSYIILLSLYYLYIRSAHYGVVIKPRFFAFKVLKQIAPYSLRTFVLGLCSRLIYYTSSIIIAIYLGTTQVTRYDITYKLCFYVTYLFSIISTSMFPKYSHLFALDNIDSLRLLYIKTVKITLAIMIVLGIFILFWGPSFIAIWVGKENFAGLNILIVLLIMNFFHALGTPAVALLQGIGRNKEITCSEIINGGLNLLFSIFLVKRMNLLGIALGGLLAHLCTSFWVAQITVIKSIKLSLKQFFLSSLLPPLSVGVIVGGAIWFFKHSMFLANSLVHLALNAMIILLVYLILYLFIGSTREERLTYVRLIKKGN